LSDINYNWTRFWYQRGTNLRLVNDSFLYDHESAWGDIFNPHAKTFATISTIPCLVLLGEPGIGKTYEVNLQSQNFRQANPEVLVIQEDLGSCSSEDRLYHNIFESKEYKTWLTDTDAHSYKPLYLFLDGLDECLLNPNFVNRIFAREFEKHKDVIAKRLYLRITCRSADWPTSMEETLKKIWREENVGIYQLAFLRQSDVANALKVNGLDSNEFFEQINRKHIVPLATKPVTLNLLLRLFKNGQFPDTQIKLYREGCRLLCEEDEKRTKSSFKETSDTKQRLEIASKIAFLSVFTGKNLISTGLYPEDEPGCINVRDLVSREPIARSSKIVWSEAVIKEVLATGLFVAKGVKLFGWTHQTYAEFLAAEYIAKFGSLTLPQILSLVTHPTDGKLIPQLKQTVAWLASMNREVFQSILKLEPEVLLFSDLSRNREEDRAQLAATILDLYDKGEMRTPEWNGHFVYAKLNHPGIAELVRPYLIASSRNEIVRREAIDFITACNLRELQDDLAAIVMDSSQPEILRMVAVYAIKDVGDETSLAKLKSYFFSSNVQNTNDDLKSDILEVLWIKLISPKELFGFLTPENSRLYEAFLPSIVPGLRATDLPIALEWIKNLPDYDSLASHFFDMYASLPSQFFKVIDKIMLLAWEHLKEPNVLPAFAEIALSKWRLNNPVVSQYKYIKHGDKMVLGESREKRRLFFDTIIGTLVDTGSDYPLVSNYAYSGLIRREDVEWLLKLTTSEIDEKMLATLNEIISNIGSFVQDQNTISSSEDVTVKRQHKNDSGRQKRISQKSLPEVVPISSENIISWLEKAEAKVGNIWSWYGLCLVLNEDNSATQRNQAADLTLLPAWQAASADTKKRIIEVAKKHVSVHNDRAIKWLGDDLYPELVRAGYKALRLLSQEDKVFIENLPPELWKNWAGIILAYRSYDEADHGKDLATKLYRHAQNTFIEALIKVVHYENKFGYITVLPKLEHCWDNRLYSIILNEIKKNSGLERNSFKTLLEILIAQQYEPAIDFAKELILVAVSKIGASQPKNDEVFKGVIASCALLTHHKDAAWSTIWPLIEKNTEYGRMAFSEFVDTASYRNNNPYICEKLTHQQIADLYIWLAQQYRHKEDPRHEGMYAVEIRDKIAQYRDALLQFLRDFGSIQACSAIEKIRQKLPELDWLKWTLATAQDQTRRNTWVPVTVYQLLELADSAKKRFVQNGRQLLDLVLASLENLQQELQGETPSANVLWNTVKDNYHPKDENELSDYVKRHLERELGGNGVIVNREVEIRASRGGTGEITDIHIDAVISWDEMRTLSRKVTEDIITVIIEVKGCWHDEVETAMETQLLNRYLKDNSQCQHGIYIVGWYVCQAWNGTGDYRKGRVPKYNLEEARNRFRRQAESLSKDGIVIEAVVLNTALHHLN
jgi:hypothetical protein